MSTGELQHYLDSSDVVLETWPDELQQASDLRRSVAWSPYEHQYSSHENRSQVPQELIRPVPMLGGGGNFHGWKGSILVEGRSQFGDWRGAAQGEHSSLHGDWWGLDWQGADWQGGGQYQQCSPNGTALPVSGFSPVDAVGSSGSQNCVTRASTMPIRSLAAAPTVAAPVHARGRCKRKMRIGT